jgi:hypothetical protein
MTMVLITMAKHRSVNDNIFDPTPDVGSGENLVETSAPTNRYATRICCVAVVLILLLLS